MKLILINDGCPAPASKPGNSNKSLRPDNNSPIAQRASILRWFFNISSRLSTLDAREHLGIMSPASRVFELRDMGHNICTEWEAQVDSSGTKHRVGVYVYMGYVQADARKEV